MENKLEYAKQLINDEEYVKALKILKDLAYENPNNSKIPYLLGIVALSIDEENLAYDYFMKSETLGYENANLFYKMAVIESNLEKSRESEMHFNKAIALADKDESFVCYDSLITFYLEHNMFLKADKLSKRLMLDFPNNYIGYHYQIECLLLRNRDLEAKSFLNMIPENFKKSPLFLMDNIKVLQRTENSEMVINEIDNNKIYEKIIPNYSLKIKYNMSSNMDAGTKSLSAIIKKLVVDYGDIDGIFALMLINFENKNFEVTANICQYILEYDANVQGLRFYIALYFQMYCLYFMSENKPSRALVDYIQRSGDLCLNYFATLESKEIYEIVDTSIGYLYDTINNLI